MVRFKPGALFEFVEPETLRALADLHDAWRDAFGASVPFVVTSGTDGTHQSGSFHYEGKAFDIRTRDLSLTQRAKLELLTRTFQRTHAGWQVILEPDHGHIELDGLAH